MVLSHACYSLFTDWKAGHDEADARVKAVITRILTKELPPIEEADQNFATAVAGDPAIIEAFSSKNRDALAKAINSAVDKAGMDALVTILDKQGKVFYSNETPAKFGYSIADKCPGVNAVNSNSTWSGAAAFSPTGQVTLTSMSLIKSGSTAPGIVAISQPLNNQFLAGLVSKFKFLEDDPNLKAVDLAIVSAKEGKVVAFTHRLNNDGGSFLAKINESGLKAIPGQEFEANGRLWLTGGLKAGSSPVGIILVSASLPPIASKALSYTLEVSATAIIAAIFAFVFSTAISGSIRQPLNFLIGRTQDLTAQKSDLEPLESLEGEWLELAELIDTAVSSMRSTIQNLKGQLLEHSSETTEKSKQDGYSSEQLLHLNRELSEKSRQLAELTRQVNAVNQQAITLKQKLDAVLLISTDGFLVLDQFGSVLSANAVFLNWMGVQEGEIAGRLCFDLVRKPGEPRSDSSSQSIARSTGNPGDLINQFYPEGVVYHKSEDKSVEVLTHLHPVVTDNQNVQGWIMVLHDRSLRSEVAQLRAEIAALLSDSIRSPLISVEPTWKTVLAGASQTMHPSVGQTLVQLHTHYEQLIGLVDSLLMMYGGIVPPPAIPRESVIVTRLVAECLEEVAAVAREHQLSLDYKTVTGLPNLSTDREALKRVILQLLEKMIGITATGGRVRVESLVKGQELRIGITSSGPPVPQSEIDDMFVGFIEDRHAQATYSSRLSMYLSRDTIERLGGRIWAESDPTRGSSSIYFIMSV